MRPSSGTSRGASATPTPPRTSPPRRSRPRWSRAGGSSPAVEEPAEPALLRAQSYRQIAATAGTSEASVRQRVSRGLRTLRAPLLVYRAAQELMRQDREYRFGGGHRTLLAAVGPRDPLDCSGAASLLLKRAGALDSDTAWVSGRFAEAWGQAGEGEHITLWASEDHVWLEFKLDGDHGERFDPTPPRRAPDAGWLAHAAGPKREFTPRHLPGL